MGFFSNLVSRFAGSSTKQGDEPLDSGESAQLSRALSYFEKRLRESDVIRPEGVQVLLDAIGAHGIAVMLVPDDGLGEAINDRLRRAAA